MSDDLDALLDEALDVMDEQERKHHEEVERREQAAAQLLMEQRPQPSEGSGGDEAALMGAVASLLDVLRKGPEALVNAPADEMQRIQTVLSRTLENLKEGATDEERQGIERCSEMLKKADEVSDDPASPPSNAPPTTEELKAMEELMKSLEQLNVGGHSGTGSDQAAQAASPEALQKMCEELLKHHNGEKQPNGVAPSSSKSLPHAPAEHDANAHSAADEEAAKLLLDILKPESLSGPFRAMTRAFPLWFDRHGKDCSAEDMQRYKKQLDKMSEVCTIIDEGPIDAALKPDATDDEKERLFRFSTALEELQALGQPPPSLNEMIAEEFQSK